LTVGNSEISGRRPAERENIESNEGEKLESIGGDSLAGKKLVLFLSSNADSLVSQISTLAASQELQSTLHGLLLAGEIKLSQEARVTADFDTDRSDALVDELEAFAKRVATGADAPTIRRNLADLMIALARSSHTPEELSSISAEESRRQSGFEWFRDHPDAFRAEGGGL